MDTSRELLFFFSALGVFNGFILSAYFLFFAKPKHISNFFLGMLLLALSLRIGKSVFYHFNDDLAREFLQLGITGCAFIGPALYFYLKSMITPEGEFSNTWKYHFSIILAVALIGGYLYPWRDHREIWSPYVVRAVYWLWSFYLIASAFIIRNVFQDFFARKDKMQSIEIWILSIFFGNLIIHIAYRTVAYTSYIAGALSFSFIFYLLVLLFFFHKKRDSILFKKQPKYADKKIDQVEAEQLLQKLEQIMKDKELYKNPSLKLNDVAKELNIVGNRLSQLLNDNLGKSFSSFINEYRIEEAKRLLVSNQDFTLEAIGYEAGFSSKSSFYSIFKKYTSTTPSNFKKSQLS